ncbi:MAG: DEAD/DEAH box helicase [Planctomyces sp.]|nr:DEAD/DEAH box helicase [Planctomyces sp.]
MDVFDLRNRLVEDYERYTRSFIKISDPGINAKVEEALKDGELWPEPLLQLNPTFLPGGTIDSLVDQKLLHSECRRIFRADKSDTDHTGKQLTLHMHQAEAIRKAKENKSYVLTSGTGSGKSLTYIVPIVDHILRRGTGRGVQAIVVYPMNALANSQDEELAKFLKKGYPEGQSPVRYARYTGQEKGEEREAIRSNPPDILLTNYMMLELLLTRTEDREIVRAAQGLRYLVFDELHTYRGRQGADVALLIRRCRLAFGGHDMICVGTSATMASEGNSLDQKKAVAAVASTLFGTSIEPDQVIGETLERSTPEIEFTDAAFAESIRSTVDSKSPPEDYEEFRNHPLASWIESTFGVRTEQSTGRLIRQAPQRLRGKESAAQSLAAATGVDAAACVPVIQQFLMKGSNLRRNESARFPIFAFRLHQFFTRGDTVWATIEPETDRYLSIHKQVAHPKEPEKLLYPMAFCRHCGTAYYRVTLKGEKDGQCLTPRENRRDADDEKSVDAYLFVSKEHPWPAGDGPAVLDRLPSFMKEMTAQGTERIRPDQRRDLPEIVHVNPQGMLVAEGHGIEAALIRNNFLFCLHPHCGVAYTRLQRSERQKLATLGVDSRSTATTILAVRALIELQSNSSLKAEARKLLSFTDNRQDASLQAGHFNDFAQVALLRSALHKAATAKGEAGLSHGDLSRSVFEALSLEFDEYAADSDVRGPARNATKEALRRVIDYYLYRDLQRGWRVTAPNLEDCGMLTFDYEGLTGDDSLLSEDELWKTGFTVRIDRESEVMVETPPGLRACPQDVREEILRTLLDVLRRSLAIKVDSLDPQKHLDLVEQTNPRLLEGTVWYLEDTRELVRSQVAYPRAKQPKEQSGLFVSSFGSFGRYLKRMMLEHLAPGTKLSREDVDKAIQFLFMALRRYGILEQVRSGDIPGYQLNHDALRWIAGNGDIRPIDRTRLLESGEMPPEVNKYFVECYRNFIDLKCLLEAREHTAQVASEDREEREDRFRSADLPLLFCSPTMELGVDISQLNVVNLRNVPPTPANYAQRSGRAGRGGQPALVYTYCAGQSPHDQYYFRQPRHMVAGSVAAPRIDLRNRDLVRSHIHAIWMEVVKPDLGKTLMSVLEIRREEGKIHLPVKDSLREALVNPAHRARALEKANDLVATIADHLATAGWFHSNWTREVLEQIERSFDRACERWREMYRAAVRQRELHHKIILDHSRPEPERKHSSRLRSQAETQIRLLTEAEGIYEGDFYSYRYFAAEGFLPGYNFPRLPISAFVPARRRRKGRDEYVSRPRFLAISEFGPRALVYHEGARYRVYKVNLDFGSEDIEETHSLVTTTIKRCLKCGYGHLEVGTNLSEVCERCGTALEGLAIVENLVQLQNCSLKLAQRITCDEEERQRFGYRLVTSYRFPEIGGKLDRKDAEVYVDGNLAMKLSYADATDLYRINLGWATQKPNENSGFWLDLERGYWGRNQADEDDQEDASAGRQMRVVPFVNDTKNALVIRFEPVRSLPEMASLQAAFKEAILKHFQLEPRELTSEPLPSPKERNEILFYESSEGGAGVLRQLAEDPSVIPAIARRALAVCHFDPETLEDLKADACGKACYECLLDYFNQPDHQQLDRFLIRDILAELARSECRPAGGMGSRGERMVELRRRCDSQLEKRWLDMIDRYMFRPPSDAQYLVDYCMTRPDFFYRDFNTAIYIDGPVHDQPDTIRADEQISENLIANGITVIRFHHAADWMSIFRQHPDIFGVPQA